MRNLYAAWGVIAHFNSGLIIREYFPAGGSRAVLHAWVANQFTLEFIDIEW